MACLRSALRLHTNCNAGFNLFAKSALIPASLQYNVSKFQQSCISTASVLSQRGSIKARHNDRSASTATSPQADITHTTADHQAICTGVSAKVNRQIADGSHGRLFAVVFISGHQFKITSEDLLLLRTNKMFPDVGERICIEKVLLVGGKDFTMVGRPLLNNARVEATVVEKTLSHHKTWFFHKKRKHVKKLRLVQDFLTVIRINSIQVSEVEDEVD